ncbi:MAG: alpha/beta hydrolase [Ignavibacteriae bacterium]|nr:alpha/beta hydrolase [Ignavibacteriota bacterium]
MTASKALCGRIRADSLYWLVIIAIGFALSCSSQNKEPQRANTYSSLDSKYLNDSTLVFDKQYQATVFSLIRSKTLDLLSSDTSLRTMDNQWNLVRVKVILETFTDQAVRNFWLHVVVKDQIENYGVKNTDSILKLFYEHSNDSASVHEIRELYNDDVQERKGHTIAVYKTVGPFALDAHIFYPDNFQKGQQRPAIILFHGGSWYQGKPEWMFGSCKRYASLGMVAIAVEYRVYDRHGVAPLECISDAKSAIRWARKNALDLGLNPNEIVASGFSAGGHLVACAAMLNILDEPGEDTTISSKPNAMIFSSSCFDPTLDQWFVKQVETRYPAKGISPNHLVRSGLPPSLVVHGTDDRMCPFRTAETFVSEMTTAGNKCEFHRLRGATHFYFFEKKYRDEAIQSEETFLASLGFLSKN